SLSTLDTSGARLGQKDLDTALSRLVTASRTLMPPKSLRLKLIGGAMGIEEDHLEVESRLRSVGHAIAATLRAGGQLKDLSSIYSADCYLAELDLTDARFRDALILWSTLRKSKLNGASFHGAELLGSDFSVASAENADLGGTGGDFSTDPIYRYFDRE